LRVAISAAIALGVWLTGAMAGSPPEQLVALLKSDTRKWSKVIHEAGIRVE
jgi:hypothetical protein